MKMRALIVSVLAVATAVTGCGATETTQAAHSLATESAVAERPQQRLGEELMAAFHDAQLEQGTVFVETEVKAGEESIAGTAALRITEDGTSADMNMTIPPQPGEPPQRVRLIVFPTEVFVKFAGVPDIPSDKWLKMSADSDDPLSQQFAPMFDQMARATDPSSLLDSYGSVDLQAEGSETVDGVKTTKYVGTVDVSRMLETATGSAVEGLEALLSQGAQSVDIAYWIGDDNLVYQATNVFTVAGQQFSTTMTMSKWGQPVEIEAPDEADVISLADLAG